MATDAFLANRLEGFLVLLLLRLPSDDFVNSVPNFRGVCFLDAESAETTEADAVVSEISLPLSPSEYIPVVYIKRSASMLMLLVLVCNSYRYLHT